MARRLSPGASARQFALTNARRLTKSAYSGGISVVRSTGLFGFAREMIDVDAVIARAERTGQRVTAHRWPKEEPQRVNLAIPGCAATPELTGVSTVVTLLDITEPGFSLRNGFLIDPERRAVHEQKVVPLFGELRVGLVPLERPRRVEGSVGWLFQANNYGHWLLFALPLIRYYREILGTDPDYYYVGPTVTGLHVESLGLLGIAPERILGDAVESDRLLVALADRAEGYDAEFLRYANETLLPDAAIEPTPRRLFVSRAGAAHRRIVNEAECAAALRAAFAVELVSTERMTLADEIVLFRSAELVVGGHGAGLANLAFAPPGARLVEITSPTFWNPLFAEIAAVNRQPYALLRGRAVGLRAGVPGTRHDFEVDIPELERTVAAALTV